MSAIDYPLPSRPPPVARLANWTPWSQPNPSLIGHADVVFAGGWRVNGIPVFRKADGSFSVGVPNTPDLDRDGRVKLDGAGKRIYRPLIQFDTAAARERWQAAVLDALRAAGIRPRRGGRRHACLKETRPLYEVQRNGKCCPRSRMGIPEMSDVPETNQDPEHENVAGAPKLNGGDQSRKAVLEGSTPLSGNGTHGDNVVSMPIPDPGDDEPSAYTSAPSFAGRQGIKRKTSILLAKPKNYGKSLFSMAARQGQITLIDIAKADAMNKDLHLILPGIANDDELMHDVVGAFEALAVPFIDRHGIAHLWCIRQCSADGREISSYAGALRAAQFAEEHWSLITWVANDWEYEEHRNPDRIRAEWPKALRSYDDWLENAFAGRIIRAADHDILEMARGKR